jgi:hypothetical protein
MSEEVIHLLLAFAGNLVSSLILVLGIYHHVSKKTRLCLHIPHGGLRCVLLCNLLVEVEIDLAFALGLFAIFGIIRYRTDAVPIREMTYLFIVIALAVLNALAPQSNGVMLIALANALVWILTLGARPPMDHSAHGDQSGDLRPRRPSE